MYFCAVSQVNEDDASFTYTLGHNGNDDEPESAESLKLFMVKGGLLDSKRNMILLLYGIWLAHGSKMRDGCLQSLQI